MDTEGMGVAFKKAHDPEKLYQWYEKHLGPGRFQGLIFQVEDLDHILRTLILEGIAVP